MARAPFEIAGVQVKAGTRETVEVPVAKLYTHTPLHIPVEVVHGRRDGPVLMVCGAIHGDEINGVEIIRRVLKNGRSGTCGARWWQFLSLTSSDLCSAPATCRTVGI